MSNWSNCHCNIKYLWILSLITVLSLTAMYIFTMGGRNALYNTLHMIRGNISNSSEESQFHIFDSSQTWPVTCNITVFVAGRLGNHLFQLASLQGIAATNRLQIVYPVYMKDLFYRLKLSKSLKATLQPKVDVLSYSDYKETHPLGYNKETHRLKDWVRNRPNIRLYGYFQSFKYFESLTAQIREQYTFVDKFQTQAHTFLSTSVPGHLRNHTVTFIGIHVRRGDFLWQVEVEHGMVAVPLGYILKAKSYMKAHYQNVLFVATGDDKGWIRRNILDNETVVSPFSQAEVDLALLASCNHTIISAGSYSWWAGWLANGTTIYYDLYPGPGSKLGKGFKKEDYYPPHWIPMR